MKQYLPKVNTVLGRITGIIYVFVLLKQFYRPDAPMFILPFHVFMTAAVVMLLVPLSIRGKRSAWMQILDLLAYGVCIFLTVYYALHVQRMQLRFDGIDPVYFGETLAFWVGIPIILEGVRRTTGLALVFVVLGFIIYGFGIVDLPGLLAFSGFRVKDYIEITMLGTEGVFGVASNAMVTMVFYFILFGAFFSATNGGEVFIDLSLLVSGRHIGGAAKSAIISSALFGMISGSAVANVTSTGVLTMPLMKRTGYSADQAAATEAVASTGGQLMPPIMGVAAFVMADMLGLPYTRIALAGLIPALGYYVALFVSVDLLARRSGIGSVDYALLKKNMHPLLPRLHLLLSPVAIITALFLGFSVPLSALAGAGAAAVVPLARKSTWYSVKKIPTVINDTALQMAKIGVAASAIGVIIAVSIQSGVAIRFVSMLARIGSGNLMLSLFMVILGCLILGLGLPTIAAYIISAVIFVPALSRLGIQPLAAHFFVLYYSVLSMITPPVCIAAFAAAGVARSNPNKTGFMAFALGLAIFFLPFGFVRDMALLGVGTPLTIIAACFGVLCGTCSWAIALQGWLGKKLKLPVRAVFLLLCITIIFQRTYSTFWWVGIAIFLLISAVHLIPVLRKPSVPGHA